jgi:hypothetical protein
MIKLSIRNQIRWVEHRSGWGYVLDALERFKDESGILFDGNIDISFGYSAYEKRMNNILPYKEDWIGFIHSSVTQCPFMGKYASLDSILSCSEFLDSLDKCRGIFTLSEYTAEYIRSKLGHRILVVALKHPTEFPQVTFNIQKFRAEKKIIHVGNWLRRITSFSSLDCPAYNKILLLNPGTLGYLGDELNSDNSLRFDFDNIVIRQHLPNEEYDHLFGESIVFIDLCDCGAVNTIIECIVRNTPILVNRHKPVVEYLGEDYPFYYDFPEEATAKLRDDEALLSAYHYLSDFTGKLELTMDHFLRAFVNSDIIRELTGQTSPAYF